MRQLRPPSLLEQLGLSGAQRAAVLGSLVGRMAAPASERAADLFDLQPTVTVHDLTSTCCEGAADRQPLEGSGATHPGVHGLRTNSVDWDAERLWRTCVTRTDLEAVLRSLGSALGLRPIHHRRPARKATQAESWQRAIHERLGVDASPGGGRKLVVQPRRRREHAWNAVPHA